TGLGVQPQPAVVGRLPRLRATTRPACAADRPTAGGGDEVRRLGRPPDPHQRQPTDDREHQRCTDHQKRSARAHPARPRGRLTRRRPGRIKTLWHNPTMADLETVTLRDPSSSLTATYVPRAGMIGTSLSDDGVELLGQRRGLHAYMTTGKT